MKPIHPTVPLTEDDRDVLKQILYERLRLFMTAFLIILPLAFICSLRIDRRDHHWNGHEDGDGVGSRGQMYLISILWLQVPLITIGTAIYLKRIHCYKKDLKAGVKQCVPYTIIRKEAFDLTGQYFFSFNDPDYMHHEVDAGVFNTLSEGDIVTVYRAPYSRYTFNLKGRFTIM